MAVDAQDNLYVIDSGNSRVQKFDRDGKLLTMWGSHGEGDGQFMSRVSVVPPGEAAVDDTGNLYIADSGNHRIQKFDSHGQVSYEVGQHRL